MEILKSCQCITILDWLSEHAGVKIYLIFESHQISLWLCTVRPLVDSFFSREIADKDYAAIFVLGIYRARLKGAF